jgi:hypothetical protein
MYAYDDCGAAILSAAHRARVLAVELFITPKNPTLIEPFFETAMTIDEVGDKLGIDELNDLSGRLMAAALQEMASTADVSKLDSVLARLTVIADDLTQSRYEQLNKPSIGSASTTGTARFAPTSDRWHSRQ